VLVLVPVPPGLQQCCACHGCATTGIESTKDLFHTAGGGGGGV